jgi:hypothetical protein
MDGPEMTPYSAQWASEPEPDKSEMTPDGRVILETEDATCSAYLWESHNCQEGWLAFDGELAEVER